MVTIIETNAKCIYYTLNELKKNGKQLSVFSPAAFGASLTLITREFVPENMIYDLIASKQERLLNFIGIPEISEYMEEHAEHVPRVIREKFLRFFEVGYEEITSNPV